MTLDGPLVIEVATVELSGPSRILRFPVGLGWLLTSSQLDLRKCQFL